MASSTVYTHRYNPHPRLSANQLAEYLIAGAPRRKSILQEAKFPPVMIIIRYDDARTVIGGHLAGTARALEDAIAALRAKAASPETSPNAAQNYELSIQAIESFRKSVDEFAFGGALFSKPSMRNRKLQIAGVTISVSIDASTAGTKKDGTAAIGAAMLMFCKSARSEAKETEWTQKCKTVASLIYALLKSSPDTVKNCDPNLCMVIDVFNGKVHKAKHQQKQLMNAITAACEEISLVWPSIKPNAKYNGPPVLKVA